MTTRDRDEDAPFAWFLRWHYRLTPADVEPTEVPGYWRMKEPCGGAAGGCRALIHSALLNAGPTRHTISYTDPPRDGHGRFASPYRTWRRAREGAGA